MNSSPAGREDLSQLYTCGCVQCKSHLAILQNNTTTIAELEQRLTSLERAVFGEAAEDE